MFQSPMAERLVPYINRHWSKWSVKRDKQAFELRTILSSDCFQETLAAAILNNNDNSELLNGNSFFREKQQVF